MASHRIDPERPGHDWSSISYAVAILSPVPGRSTVSKIKGPDVRILIASYSPRPSFDYGLDFPIAASLIRSLKWLSSDGAQISSKIATLARSNVILSPTHGFVYAFGSVRVIVSSMWSGSIRR